MPNDEFTLGIRHSSFFRHSSFVIRHSPTARGVFVILAFVIRAALDIGEFGIRHSLRIIFALLALSPGIACLADEPELTRYEFREVHMGTQFRIILYTADEPFATAASRAAFDRIAQLDAMLSDYRDDSELMRLCRQAGGPPVRVSDELFFVLSKAKCLAKTSEGSFDVTVGPIVRLWRRARRMHQWPDPERLTRARELVGNDLMRIEEKARTVQLLKPGMQLDLGGIAKGYAADEAIAVLKRLGITRSLVAAGGDIVVSSPPPQEPGWTIGIAPLEQSDARPSHFLLLHDAAVSTSGDTEQFVEIGGKRYSHIVDPHSGLGVLDRSHVTVVARHGIESDSLATAISVLGPRRGISLVESTDGAAALIVRISEEGRETLESGRFREIPRGQPKKSFSTTPQ